MKIAFKTILSILILSTASLAQEIGTPQWERAQEAESKARQLARIMQLDYQPTPNQLQYDVKHYDLDLIIDVSAKKIIGAVRILSQVVVGPLSTMEVNLLKNMVVDSVVSSGKRLAFSHKTDLIKIELGNTYQLHDYFSVKIYYRGQPEQSDFGAFGFSTHSGQPMIWSLSEPYGARNWWPCKDFPIDKADSVDIRVTVPIPLIVASNGTLRSETKRGNYKTYWWHESYPIVTYLVSVAIYPYHVYSDYYRYSPNDSMEVRYYVFPDQLELIRSAYAKTVRMIDIFSKIFGEYPFIREKYGHAQFMGFANMEHQTLTSLVSRSEGTIVHELAHQWWGDYITCQDFHHIWLNEGFATYSEALYYEREYGVVEFKQEMESNKYFGGGTIYVSDVSKTSLIFNYDRSYRKAAWVLHMLRHVVGDENFFKILKAYYNDNRLRYGTATTEDFKAICERVSGINLEKFFQQWIFKEYFPKYRYSWNWQKNGTNYDIQLTIEQLQTNQIFWMPIDVTITTFSGEQTFVVWDSLKTQVFNLAVADEPLRVELDKDDWILKEVELPVIQPTFDHGILLVNGVSWQRYGTELANAYQSRAFWDNYPISFWDCFGRPLEGYPSSLPIPIGTGRILPEVLGKFSTVIWIGDFADGDIDIWRRAGIYDYLQSGGNVLLISRRGRDYLDALLQSYLGISWAENALNTTQNCIAQYPGLTNMTVIGEQTDNAVFNTNLVNSESRLLFQETASFSVPRGLGVWRKPSTGGKFRNIGGQFVFISGRPYRYQSDDLRSNIAFILKNMFQESDIDQPGNPMPSSYELFQNYPNPFNSGTEIAFQIPETVFVKLEIYDLLGRKVTTLLDKKLIPGRYAVRWHADGISTGIYFYNLETPNFRSTRKMILVK
ncbi:MAG: M1 family aminopeptidase [candidate division KSB1 bacterium]|nr:M1 family aminopeptidase [candidate division KSB1 bacterium]